jgi:4-amino-4-deoxy-L-arabinose transferase-like glycosyltransferase
MIQVKRSYKIAVFVSIAVLSLAMHVRHFSKDLLSMHVWRQTQTQSTILSFYEEDFNIFNPHHANREDGDGIYRMEFPLMQWLIAGLYKIFGNHILITRLFTFILGLCSVAAMYQLLLAVFRKESLALIGAWAFNFSPCFYYYTINPLPDNFALCMSLWGVALFFSWIRNQKRSTLFLTGIFLAVGSLCKLPFILYYTVPATYFILAFIEQRETRKQTLRNVWAVFGFVVFPLAWYSAVIPTWHGNGIVAGILVHTVPFSMTLGYVRYIVVSTLPELLLNYGSVLFFFAGFYFLYRKKLFKQKWFMVFLVWSLALAAYYIFEIDMIASIHDYYLFPFYPLLFLLVGYGAYSLLETHKPFLKYLTFALLLILPLAAHLRTADRWNPEKPGFNKDLWTYKEELRNAVPKNALCIAGDDDSFSIFLYYIDKKGWSYAKTITQPQMRDMVGRGAQYLYSDTRAVDESKDVAPFLDKLILERGSIRVYKLKMN